jgi:hypothetical protein
MKNILAKPMATVDITLLRKFADLAANLGVYEGKSLASMMDMVRKGEIGQLALNAYSEIRASYRHWQLN